MMELTLHAQTSSPSAWVAMQHRSYRYEVAGNFHSGGQASQEGEHSARRQLEVRNKGSHAASNAGVRMKARPIPLNFLTQIVSLNNRFFSNRAYFS